MALEIERKFLLCSDEWRCSVHEAVHIRQGYFCHPPLMRGRIRVYGNKGFVTFKSEPRGFVRHEYEYEIPGSEAIDMLARFCIEPPIIKKRHLLYHETLLWEVDEFEDANRGLVLAEVELKDDKQSITIPPWAGLEVTEDSRYGNSSLVQCPYTTWATV